MKHKNRGIGWAIALGLLFAGIAYANERVDPNGDFSNLSQRLIIKYSDAEARDMVAEARDLSARSGSNLLFVRSLGVPRFHLFQLAQRVPEQAWEALIDSLDRAPNVELVERDRLVQANVTPNDPLYPDQWHYFEATGGINLPPAWDKQTGNGVVVAVLDTGYTDHADLVSRIVAGYDFIDDPFVANDGDGRDPDAHDPGDWMNRWECGMFNPFRFVASSWHGTHTSGTVAAETGNGLGVAGTAHDAMVLPVRVLGKCGGYTADIADGIVWASGGSVPGISNTAYTAQVINMSLGGSGSCPSVMQSAINTARSNGATVVTSAGNSNTDAGGFFPANCSGVVAVAASDRDGNRASYSNYGAIVDITAPGGETAQTTSNGVLSTLNDGRTSPGSDIYAYYQGTSMAAPHVSGSAALVYAAAPGITPGDVESALKASARPLPGSCSGGCGAGIVDADAAVVYVTGGNISPTASFTYTANELIVDFTDTSTDDQGVVSWNWDFGDGNGSNAQHPQHTYTAGGTYTVTLTVTDADTASDSASQSVTVSIDSPPTASFTYTENGLTVNFTDTSTDDQGIASWTWDFGDGNGSNAQHPQHTYGADGTYTVTLTVTDTNSASDSTSQSVTVEAASETISLSANGYKVKGRHNVDLSWDGATATDVDIYRDGTLVTTTANDGFYTDAIGSRGSATYVHQVCEAGTATCSNQTTTRF